MRPNKEKHHNWKGGKLEDAKGYILIHKSLLTQDEINRVNLCKGHYVREHRLEMVRKLGRPIEDGKVVHHIDKNPKNNNQDNLVEVSKYEHRVLHRNDRKHSYGIFRSVTLEAEKS